MGLRGDAAIVGYVELPPERLNQATPAPFVLEQWAELAAAALADAGLPADVVNGIAASHLAESQIFVPSTIAEYLGIGARFAELVDLGGASAAAMVWRAAAAIELGICDAVLCALPARYITPSSKKKPRPNIDAMFFGSSSNQYGSPQAEFEIPYGNLGQNGPYGQVAQRYAAVYGYDERAMAKIVVDQRVNANHTDGAIWKDKPLTVEEYLSRPWKQRLGYRMFRNPLVMFGVGPIWSLMIGPRIWSNKMRPRQRRSVLATNLALAVVVGAIVSLAGLDAWLLVQMPIAILAGTMGVFMFYVQHQFEDVYWQHHESWSYAESALQGSSYLKLPALLQFFTGNIGLHHVHHLSARIPNYNLQRAHDENPVFHDVPTLTLWDGIRSLRLKLYDEQRSRLVSFSTAR